MNNEVTIPKSEYDALQDQAYNERFRRRQKIFEILINAGYTTEDAIKSAAAAIGFIESEKPTAIATAVAPKKKRGRTNARDAIEKFGGGATGVKRRGRPVTTKFSAVKPVKRKYTKRSKFWGKK